MSDVALTVIQKIIEEKATKQAHDEYRKDPYAFVSALSIKDIAEVTKAKDGSLQLHTLKTLLTNEDWDYYKALREKACAIRIRELISQYSNEVVKNAIASHAKI
jgi:hypothetical protein